MRKINIVLSICLILCLVTTIGMGYLKTDDKNISNLYSYGNVKLESTVRYLNESDEVLSVTNNTIEIDKNNVQPFKQEYEITNVGNVAAWICIKVPITDSNDNSFANIDDIIISDETKIIEKYPEIFEKTVGAQTDRYKIIYLSSPIYQDETITLTIPYDIEENNYQNKSFDCKVLALQYLRQKFNKPTSSEEIIKELLTNYNV